MEVVKLHMKVDHFAMHVSKLLNAGRSSVYTRELRKILSGFLREKG